MIHCLSDVHLRELRGGLLFDRLHHRVVDLPSGVAEIDVIQQVAPQLRIGVLQFLRGEQAVHGSKRRHADLPDQPADRRRSEAQKPAPAGGHAESASDDPVIQHGEREQPAQQQCRGGGGGGQEIVGLDRLPSFCELKLDVFVKVDITLGMSRGARGGHERFPLRDDNRIRKAAPILTAEPDGKSVPKPESRFCFENRDSSEKPEAQARVDEPLGLACTSGSVQTVNHPG